MKYLILFFLLFSMSIQAQKLNKAIPGIPRQFPVNTIKMTGIGNKGFDDYIGYYNPDYKFMDKKIEVSLIGLANLHYSINSSFNNSNLIEDNNNLILKPGLISFNLLLECTML